MLAREIFFQKVSSSAATMYTHTPARRAVAGDSIPRHIYLHFGTIDFFSLRFGLKLFSTTISLENLFALLELTDSFSNRAFILSRPSTPFSYVDIPKSGNFVLRSFPFRGVENAPSPSSE